MRKNSRTGPLAAPGGDAGSHWGFTLVEMMIVVAVIGLLAAIAIPGFARARESSRNSRFASDVRVAMSAFLQYSLDNSGQFPPDVTPGIMPTGMEEYLVRFPWSKPTSLGGKWDWDNRQFNTKAGVSVYQPEVEDSQLLRLDERIDNGDLATGLARKRTSGYIYILE